MTRAGRASGSALPASTTHLEHFEDLADEVVEVDWVIEEASARRQRVEGPELVLCTWSSLVPSAVLMSGHCPFLPGSGSAHRSGIISIRSALVALWASRRHGFEW